MAEKTSICKCGCLPDPLTIFDTLPENDAFEYNEGYDSKVANGGCMFLRYPEEIKMDNIKRIKRLSKNKLIK